MEVFCIMIGIYTTASHQIAHLKLVNVIVYKSYLQKLILKESQKKTKLSFMNVRVIYTYTRNVASCLSSLSCVFLEHVSDSLLKPLIKNIVGFLFIQYFINGMSRLGLLVSACTDIPCIVPLRKTYSLKEKKNPFAQLL